MACQASLAYLLPAFAQAFGGQSSLAARAKTGAQGRNRTTDTCIFSAVLYRLSYLGLSFCLLRFTFGAPL